MTGFHLIDTELLPYILVGKVHWKIIFGNLGLDELHKKSVLHFSRLKAWSTGRLLRIRWRNTTFCSGIYFFIR